ncbi:hypothetical protein SmaMPs15_000083 [Stenotrophomonas maltophilia phage vB_SmaM_Ps15]|uniref:Uncharacterized protein n=1 Tax=Stenotrophomonas maltophilia phage vB_SmaM_Ps15 TaxID=3071007 RepID=A0AAE9FM56_9CAUD|nr:hypothetical protein PQC01_gp083 [Stenotrophomonas maltophilia phage vB_SmaM_Ps15]UMO77234.1 hypothetical protein SmaMPs15_000083 [Stenotrophomonas maltophilia phage vB_SmaM_Ps15]
MKLRPVNPGNPADPVVQDEESGMYYFYDEVWADLYGPFPCIQTARANLNKYAETLG